MKAILITTATGAQFIVEAKEKRCWHSEEIAEIEIEVNPNTHCDICQKPIQTER